jgi:predicted nucleic acid-binding protein
MAGSKVRYFDSSVVLSMLLNDSHAEKALHLWEESAYRVSSRLMLFENVTVIHRVALKLPANARQKWASQSAAWLEHISAQLYLHEIDAEVLDQCKAVSLLGSCRTLDAIHLATARIFSRAAADFSLASFDRRMLSAAAQAGMSCAG